jgi:hypothetical protein
MLRRPGMTSVLVDVETSRCRCPIDHRMCESGAQNSESTTFIRFFKISALGV